MHRGLIFSFSLFLLLGLVACGKPSPDSADSSDNPANHADEQTAPSLLKRLTSKDVVIPADTVITVRFDQSVGSKLSNTGDSFTATVAEPVELSGKVVVVKGASASGHIVEAVPLGRFKGGARLRLVLDSVTVDKTKYEIQTTAVSRSLKGKGKRTAAMIGGGAGGGALIGGLAGGGKGALIGAALGAGAGTAGAAYTGNKNIVLPAESTLSFKLLQPVTVKM